MFNFFVAISLLLSAALVQGQSNLIIDATKKGDVAHLKVLLADKKLRVNEPDSYKNTAVTQAAFHNQLPALKLLVAAHANIHAANQDGNTALHLAAFKGHTEVVEYLTSVKARCTKNTAGQTPCDVAAEQHNLPAMEALLKAKCQPQTAVITAARTNDLQKLALFIALNANLNLLDQYDNTALTNAIWNGHVDAAKLLIEAKASLAPQNKDGNNALHLAVLKNQVETVRLLLAHGISIDQKNKENATAESIAVTLDYQEVLKLIIEAKAQKLAQMSKWARAKNWMSNYPHRSTLLIAANVSLLYLLTRVGLQRWGTKAKAA